MADLLLLPLAASLGLLQKQDGRKGEVENSGTVSYYSSEFIQFLYTKLTKNPLLLRKIPPQSRELIPLESNRKTGRKPLF